MKGGRPRYLTIRELARNLSGAVWEVQNTRRASIITRHGRPVAKLVPLSPEETQP